MSEPRRARSTDAKPGAVLFDAGRFWDVVGWTDMGQIRLLSDDGSERFVTGASIVRYYLVREATPLDVPVLDGRTDAQRRRGIFANLDRPAARGD